LQLALVESIHRRHTHSVVASALPLGAKSCRTLLHLMLLLLCIASSAPSLIYHSHTLTKDTTWW
jgi:hypothetical protein